MSGAPATAATYALFGLLVSYSASRNEASDEDFLGPEVYEATPRRLLHGYLAVSSRLVLKTRRLGANFLVTPNKKGACTKLILPNRGCPSACDVVALRCGASEALVT